MLRLIVAILLIAPLAFAISDDAVCVDFCNKCAEKPSELCTEIVQTCQCDVSNEAVANETEITQAEQPEAVSETVKPAQSAPIMKASFAPPPEKKNKDDGAIMNVNFGYKGDSEYTAELQADGSYEMKEKNNAGVWIAIGAGALLILIGIIAAAI